MSSRTQQAQADEQRSPLLDLPAELRLMVYEEHYEIVYRPLQTKEFVAFLGRCSWPTHTIPSGLAIGNRQLFDELQAVLLRVRDADEPDILFPFHASSSNTISNHHLLSANILDSKKTPMEDEARLTSIVERFVADQRIVVVPQQQYTRQEKMRTLAKINDVEDAYKEFVMKTRSRVQKTQILHTRIIVNHDRVSRMHFPTWTRELAHHLVVISSEKGCNLRLKISVGVVGGITQDFLDRMARYLPHALFEAVKWVGASQEEDDLLYASHEARKYRVEKVIKNER